MDKNNFNIGERIRLLRSLRGMSQEYLALEADITPPYLSMIECGKKNPTIRTIEKLCGVLKIGLTDFFNDDASNDATQQEILALLDKQSPTQKRQLLEILRRILYFSKEQP